MIGLALAGCAPAPSIAPAAPLSATPTRPRPSATSTPTLIPFVLRPSGTPPPPATLAILDLNQWSSTPFPPEVNPLTGLRLENSAILNRRPLVIKITNFPRSVRPQWGLMNADHVYEYYLEDELTRFVGIFYGQDASQVGPIRSARPFDEHLLRMYKGILAFGYADDRVVDRLVNSDLAPYLVIEKPDNCPPMCRIGDPVKNYNTLFTDTAQLSAYISARGTNNNRPSLQGLAFSPNTPAGGGELTRLDIRFSPMSYHYWEYDPRQGKYLRWQDTERVPAGQETYEPLIDSLGGEQISAKNVVVLKVPTEYFFLSSDTEIYDYKLLGSGEGYALRDGRLFTITWKRPAPGDLLALYLGGQLYPLKPGNVWFEIINPQTALQSGPKYWRFLYELPSLPTVTPPPTP